MGEYNPVKGQGRQTFRTHIIAFLSRGQQRVQYLDRGLEHLDEFKQALVGQAQATRVGIGIRIIL